MPRKGQTKYKNLFEVGHKFGSWELLDAEPVKIKKGSNYYYCYKVRCGCGIEEKRDCSQLTNGMSKRCYPCSVKESKFGEDNPFWTGYGLISGKRFYRIKKGAEQRNIPFELDIQTLNERLKQNGFTCSLSGVELNKETWSLDRIDSQKGYTLDNIQYVHKDINRMKNKYSENYFIEMCKKVSENNP